MATAFNRLFPALTPDDIAALQWSGQRSGHVFKQKPAHKRAHETTLGLEVSTDQPQQ